MLAGWPSVLLGPAERFSGLLAMAAGEHEEALHLLDVAAAESSTRRRRPPACRSNKARACLRLAQRRGGQAGPAGGGPPAGRGGAAADRLGMRGLAAEAAGLLSEC